MNKKSLENIKNDLNINDIGIKFTEFFWENISNLEIIKNLFQSLPQLAQLWQKESVIKTTKTWLQWLKNIITV